MEGLIYMFETYFSKEVNVTEKLMELGKEATSTATMQGADEAEAYLLLEHSDVIDVTNESCYVKKGWRGGIGVRTVIDKSVGFASSSSFGRGVTTEVAKRAVNIAKGSSATLKRELLPYPQTPVGIPGTFDKRFQTLDLSALTRSLSDLCGNLTSINEITKTKIRMRNKINYQVVVNNHGVEVEDRSTREEVTFLAYASQGSRDEMCEKSTVSDSKMGLENLRSGLHSAVENVLSKLKSKKLDKSLNCPGILGRRTIQYLLSYIFVYAINGSNKQTSPYKNKLGDSVAAKNITMVDDGTMEGGLHTGLFDHEGVPRQKTTIIQEGILKNFIYDNYTAKLEEKTSTGNACREGPVVYPPYAVQPTIKPSNLILEPGNTRLQDLVSEIKSGILVSGISSSEGYMNLASGIFKIYPNTAFWIKNGEIAYPIRDFLITGNFHDLLKQIYRVGSDLKNFGRIICPSIAVKELKVSLLH